MITGSGRAFSTLGCPGESIEQVLAHSAVGGCSGVELRCRDGELVDPGSDLASARAVGEALRAGGVEPICLATYVQLGMPDESVGDALERHLELADAAGIPAIRVFGGDPEDDGVLDRAVSRLRGAAAASASTGVAILLETHDAFLTGESVARVLDEADVPTAGAIWDVVNPWRAGESPASTMQHLARWLRHVQVKDAAATDDLRPVLPGTGRVPLTEILELLPKTGYAGWISLEWEAAWYPDALPLDYALRAFGVVLDDRA